MNIKKWYGRCSYSRENGYYHIYNLRIYPKYRRKNKAKKLLQEIIDIIRKTGYKKDIKIVAIPRENSISKNKLKLFYKNLGLKVFSFYA
ncbi:MAG: GNAT family N-acetyltransferase [Ignavibacteria bacterium]|nr:GNAT family N-acetyltransferase [Ignavibacteria bacterium]